MQLEKICPRLFPFTDHERAIVVDALRGQLQLFSASFSPEERGEYRDLIHELAEAEARSDEPQQALLEQSAGVGAFMALLEAGLTQGDALNALSEHTQAEAEYPGHIEAARENETDEFEIDDHPLVSPSDAGVWVSSWIWIAHDELTADEDED
jgi:hypothetical protein